MRFRKYPNWKYFTPNIPYLPGSTTRISKSAYTYMFFAPLIVVCVTEANFHIRRKLKESSFMQKKKEDMIYGKLGFEMMLKSCNSPDNDVIEFFSEF